jgi:hypothetical protein
VFRQSVIAATRDPIFNQMATGCPIDDVVLAENKKKSETI